MGQVCQPTNQNKESQQLFLYENRKSQRTSRYKEEQNHSAEVKGSNIATTTVRQNKSDLSFKMMKMDNLLGTNLAQSVRNTIRKVGGLNSSKNVGQNMKKVYLQEIGGYYFGPTIKNKPNGNGYLQLNDGDYLQGPFIDGFCNGKGIYIKKDGSYYEGDIKNNMADGYGKYVDNRNGYKYEGQWKNNLPNGKGQAQYYDETKYNGEFLNSKKHGKGILMQKDCLFQGTFQHDQLQGKALMKLNNGEYFIGQWKDNMKNGKGEYFWPNGSTYSGFYVDDKRQGQGLMQYDNGDYYKGQWKNGQKDGQGQYKTSKDIIKGRWREGNLLQKYQRLYQRNNSESQ